MGNRLTLGYILGIILLAVVVVWVMFRFIVPAFAEDHKVDICHESKDGKFETLSVDEHALAGHYAKGKWKKDHTNDYFGKCAEVTPTPTVSPTLTPTLTPTPTKPPKPTPTPKPTTRLCHWNEEGFEAIAVTKSERARHEKAHELDKDWVEGMDKYCEVDEEPTPTPTPTNTPVTSNAGRTVEAPVCTEGNVQSVVANLHVVRNGSSADVNYFITEGDSSNIYWRLNSSSEWQHAVADVKGNSDNYVSYTINDLNPTGDYTFGVEQKNGCGGGNTTSVVIDDYLPQTFRVDYFTW